MGKRIVVIGGGEIGTETGLYLAEAGHNVTLLTRQSRLAPDATCTHYREMFEERWEAEPRFGYITEAVTQAITDEAVVYCTKAGTLMQLPADSVVLAGGRTANSDAALRFYGSANEFYMVGDCKKPGNVQRCMRMAYAAASRI